MKTPTLPQKKMETLKHRTCKAHGRLRLLVRYVFKTKAISASKNMFKPPKMLGTANVDAALVPQKQSRLMPIRPKPVALMKTTHESKTSGPAKNIHDAIRTEVPPYPPSTLAQKPRSPGKMQQLTPDVTLQQLTLPKPKSPDAPLSPPLQNEAPKVITPRMKYIVDTPPLSQPIVSPPEPNRIVEFLGCEGDARKYRIWIRK